MKFDIKIKGEAFYPNIEADSKEEATEIAVEWFMERKFDIQVEQKEEE